MKKYFILLGILITISIITIIKTTDMGIIKSYDNMQVGVSIDSYNLTLRIYGKYNDKSINEDIRYSNYKNKQYTILVNSDNNDNVKEDNNNYTDNNNTIYILNNKKYIKSNDSYKEINQDVLYSKSNMYLESLKNIQKDIIIREEVLGTETYNVHEVMIKKEIINLLLDDSILADITLDKDVPCEVWIDQNNYVYKIICNISEVLDDFKDILVLEASYFQINNIKEINFR